MPWDGSGSYYLPPAYTPEVNGTVIDATRYNGTTNDIASGITGALSKTGQNVPTGNLPMGGFKHTGAGNAAATGQYAVWGQAITFGQLTISAGYMILNPYSGTYDDGSYSRWYWDGNLGNLNFSRSGGSGVAGLRIVATGFIGDLTGDVTGTASQVLVAANATNATRYLTFVTATTGNLPVYTDTGITYNPSTNVLTVGGHIASDLTGDVTGNASTATALQTARNLNGVSFNGTANITVNTNVAADSTAADQFVMFAVSSGNVQSRINSGITYNPNTGVLDVAGEIITASNTPTDNYSVGFRKVLRSTSTTISRLYVGFCKSLSAGVTIPAATFEEGDALSFYNNSGSAWNLTRGGGLTMYNSAGVNSATISVPAHTRCTIWFESASECSVA